MIISQTPLRISFVGGGTDLKSFYKRTPGMVVSTAIDKYLFVILNERFDNKIYVNYANKEVVTEVNEIQHDLVRESLLKTGIKHGIEITMLADIPSEGSGLGSSSSLTVGLLNAMYQFVGEQVTAERLAKEACDIEINVLKKPIGKQDQYIAAYGGLRKIVFNTDDSVTVRSLPFDRDMRIRLGSNILLHFTNITRSADVILREQKKNTSNKFSLLSDLSSLVPILERELELSNYDALGFLLKRNWELKKQLAKGITKPEIDKMVDLASSNGATGVKISGAGGGGFLLSYVPRSNQDEFRKAMEAYTELPFMLDPFGSRIIFNMRRYNSKISI
jgi:D-glycero-alpha-D-manno-heptose-7-phosphate kinase